MLSMYKYIVFLVSLCAVSGSLYFSEVVGFIPCHLCWWQRIFMYPIVLLSLMSIIRKTKEDINFILPLSLTGMCISIYHIYLQFSSTSSNICADGVSCNVKYIEWFGFITIPVLCFTAFLIINITLLFVILKSRRSNIS